MEYTVLVVQSSAKTLVTVYHLRGFLQGGVPLRSDFVTAVRLPCVASGGRRSWWWSLFLSFSLGGVGLPDFLGNFRVRFACITHMDSE